ncbi:hypothetical protein JOB18_027757 [Solea senegalensis]|uniref:Uncharacterized protein n=1 Tax=Solea senegalensis TaxID=28829 RepID=A0AAV6RBM6_SOLSE|nr:hypothetical protein JOB18_027757 [Solea senegalensis]
MLGDPGRKGTRAPSALSYGLDSGKSTGEESDRRKSSATLSSDRLTNMTELTLMPLARALTHPPSPSALTPRAPPPPPTLSSPSPTLSQVLLRCPSKRRNGGSRFPPRNQTPLMNREDDICEESNNYINVCVLLAERWNHYAARCCRGPGVYTFSLSVLLCCWAEGVQVIASSCTAGETSPKGAVRRFPSPPLPPRSSTPPPPHP